MKSKKGNHKPEQTHQSPGLYPSTQTWLSRVNTAFWFPTIRKKFLNSSPEMTSTSRGSTLLQLRAGDELDSHVPTTASTLRFQMPLLWGGAITDRHGNRAFATPWISCSEAPARWRLVQPVIPPEGPLLGASGPMALHESRGVRWASFWHIQAKEII